MSAVVKLPEQLVNKAKEHSAIYKRSIPKQIEYWSHIGIMALENPDLPYNFLKDIIFGLKEAKNGELEDYVLGE